MNFYPFIQNFPNEKIVRSLLSLTRLMNYCLSINQISLFAFESIEKHLRNLLRIN
jgi:hypothetical protein